MSCGVFIPIKLIYANRSRGKRFAICLVYPLPAQRLQGVGGVNVCERDCVRCAVRMHAPESSATAAVSVHRRRRVVMRSEVFVDGWNWEWCAR